MKKTGYFRTCQECGHEQEMKPPAEYKNDIWKDFKCRKCKSPALDYGKYKPEEDKNEAPLR